MNGAPLEVWPEAESDFAEAAEWYESKQPGLAQDLAGELDIAFQKIVLHPELFPIVDRLRHPASFGREISV